MHEIAGLLIPRLTCPGFLGAVESLFPVTHIFFNYLCSVNICIHIYYVQTCRCKWRTRSPNPISGMGMKLSWSGFSDWACFQMRASIPAGGDARYSRNCSSDGRTLGTHETTPSALSCPRADCIMPDGCWFQRNDDSSIAGTLWIAPVAERSWTLTKTSVLFVSKPDTPSTDTFRLGLLPSAVVTTLTNWAWSRLQKLYKLKIPIRFE